MELPMSVLMPDPHANRRRSPRRPALFNAHLREPASKAALVTMTDLSRGGFQIEHHKCFAKGASVWLRLPGIEALAARAIWSDGRRLGCRFDVPLHDAVFRKLLPNNDL